MTPAEIAQLLRDHGAHDLANRWRSVVRARNASAHPDLQLFGDVHEFISQISTHHAAGPPDPLATHDPWLAPEGPRSGDVRLSLAAPFVRQRIRELERPKAAPYELRDDRHLRRRGTGGATRGTTDESAVGSTLVDAPPPQRDVRREVHFAADPRIERSMTLEDQVHTLTSVVRDMQNERRQYTEIAAYGVQTSNALLEEAAAHRRRLDELEAQLRACERSIREAGSDHRILTIQDEVRTLQRGYDDLTRRFTDWEQYEHAVPNVSGAVDTESSTSAPDAQPCAFAFLDDAAWCAVRAASRRHRDELDSLIALPVEPPPVAHQQQVQQQGQEWPIYTPPDSEDDDLSSD